MSTSITSRRRKAPAPRLLPVAVAAALAVSGAAVFAQPATNALPVVGGATRNVTFSPQGGTVAAPEMNIQQNAARGLIEWQSFNIGAAAKVNIVQPTNQSVLVNRVMPSANATSSEIYGALNANGRVFLVNSAGVTFGAGAQVNVGSLVASGLDLSPDMIANSYEALLNPATLAIGLVDLGTAGSIDVRSGATLRADPAGGGSIVLVSSGALSHAGVIDAIRGRIGIGAAYEAQVVLPATTSGFIDLVVNQPSVGSSSITLEGGSRTLAEGGSIVIGSSAVDNVGIKRGDDIVVNGDINVGSTTGAAGTVLINAGEDGTVSIGRSGTIGAVASAAGQRGGSITLSGSAVDVEERGVLTSAVPGTSSATLDASGAAGGGSITIGSDITRRVYIGASNVFSADALDTGNGGSIHLTANFHYAGTTPPMPYSNYGVTQVYGTLTARGGLQGGNGGQIETSGYALTTRLVYAGDTLAGTIDASARAAGGTAGTWTIDPFNVIISASAPTSTGPVWTPTAPDTQINSADISNALNAGTNVEINTGATGTGTQAGTITIVNGTSITRTVAGAATTLTLRAHDSISMDNATISAVDGAALNVNLFSDLDGNGAGNVSVFDSQITTSGGNLTISGGVDPATGFAAGNGQQGGVVLNGSFIDTTSGTGNAGDITVRGRANAGTAQSGVAMNGFSSLRGNNVTLLGLADRGSGTLLQDSSLYTSTGTIDVRGVATRTDALSTQAIGLEIDNAFISPGQGSVVLAGRGDDNNVAGTYPAATGLQYSNLQIYTGSNSTGTIRIAGEAANSAGAGITFQDVESGGLTIRDGTSTAIPTLANVSIGAISADGLALALGLDSNPAATDVLTTGTINFRPVSVNTTGQVVEAPAETILVGPGAGVTSGFVIDPATFGTSFRADTGFVIGSSAHTGRITVQDNALSNLTGQSITLQNEGAGSAGIELGTGTAVRDLGLLSAGAVTQNGGFAVDRTLLVGGGGNFALTDAGNTVAGTVALAAPGQVDLLVNGPLVINTGAALSTYDAASGTFGSRQPGDSSAITSAVLRSTGAITVSHDIVMTGGGGSLALVSPTSVTVDSETTLGGPLVRVWAPAVNWADGARINYYGCTYPTCAVSGITLPDAGHQALFPDRPTLTVVAGNASGTAGAAFPPFTYTSSGLINGDSAATALGGALTTPATTGSPAGTYTIDQGTLTSPTGYLIAYTPGALTLAAAPVPPPPPPVSTGLEEGREMIRSAFLAEYRSDVYGRNLAQPFICTAQSVISESVARETNADPLASEWGKVRNQPQLSGCLDVAAGGQCAAF